MPCTAWLVQYATHHTRRQHPPTLSAVCKRASLFAGTDYSRLTTTGSSQGSVEGEGGHRWYVPDCSDAHVLQHLHAVLKEGAIAVTSPRTSLKEDVINVHTAWKGEMQETINNNDTEYCGVG